MGALVKAAAGMMEKVARPDTLKGRRKPEGMKERGKKMMEGGKPVHDGMPRYAKSGSVRGR
jgi:hypothetical protein